MFFCNFFDRRKNTFEMSYELILQNMKNKNTTYNIVELGTSRSFVTGGVQGCLSPDPIYWYPNHPELWDWGAGIFTKVFAENLQGQKYILHTVDPSKEANIIVRTMCNEYEEVKIHLAYSTNFLNSFTEKIDFLYMDHMETSEEAALLHLEDAKLVVEKNLMSENGIILIDDIGPNIIGGKGKYSIPYLLNNGYKIVMHEYQVLMIRDNTELFNE
jgi:hypothetical protein